MSTDFVLTQDASGIFDISIDGNGDIKNENFLDTSILYALLGEKRALSSEVSEPSFRRGWIGNENKDFENGSKLWLYYQARLTRSVINEMESEAVDALRYLIEDGAANDIDVKITLPNNVVTMRIDIYVSESKVETRFYELWKNTGL